MRVAIFAGSPAARPLAGVQHGEECVRGVAVVLGHEVRDLGAAVAEVGAGPAGFDDGEADPERGDLLGDGLSEASMPHLVAW